MGTSSLGDFIAVSSDRGLVAFEFASAGGHAVKDLQERFPNDIVMELAEELAEIAIAFAKVIEDPGHPSSSLLT
jgi:AraC family transcriptional regulator, regulatory protein of adaptative response / methylated-DNA-[protein]-cysteine methyltransferase